MIPSHVFIFIITLYGVALMINLVVQEIGEYQAKTSPDKVWDIVWEHTPNFHQYEMLTNVIPGLLLGSLFFVKRGDSILLEFFVKFIIILLVRALTTVSTIFPKHENCDSSNLTWWNVLGGCYDKVFSGHTAFVVLFTLIFLREGLLNSATFWGINLLQMATIVLTRSHFTVDVILGFVITYLVYDGNYSILGKKI
jgi:hypothetical protein